MDTLWHAISWVARIFAWIGGAMIMLAAVIVSAEVVLRKLLALPFSGSDEIGAYLFAIGTSWSMAFALVTRGHVRIDALYGAFSPLTRAILDLVALLGLVLADDVVPAERAPMVVEAVVHALRDLVPGDVEAVTAQLPDGLRGTWAA